MPFLLLEMRRNASSHLFEGISLSYCYAGAWPWGREAPLGCSFNRRHPDGVRRKPLYSRDERRKQSLSRYARYTDANGRAETPAYQTAKRRVKKALYR